MSPNLCTFTAERVEKVDSPIGDENDYFISVKENSFVEKVDSPIGDENTQKILCAISFLR